MVQNPESNPPEPGSWIGRTIARYVLQSKIAEGPQGDVYSGTDSGSGKPVLFRLLDPSITDLSGFDGPAAALHNLRHPNISRVIETGKIEGRHFIVTDQPEGERLEAMLDRKRLPRSETTLYALQIAEALAAAHSIGVAHGGLNPSAVVIRTKRNVRVLDFGLALVAPPPAQFLSPEQIEGNPPSLRSDIFLFGSLLYRMCADRPAFDSAEAVRTQEPLPLAEATSRVPIGADRIIARCLRKDPAERYAKIAELQADLKRMKEEDEARQLSVSSWLSPSWEKILIRVIAGAVAVAILGAGVLFWRNRPRQEQTVEASVKQFTPESGFYIEPAIAPDGKTVAFASDRGSDGSLDIWIQTAGASPVQVTNHPADDREPAISPDGASVAFRSERDGGGVYIARSSGGGDARKLASFGRRPRFSPDGQWILYWVGPTGVAPVNDGEFKIYIVPTRGGEPRQLRPDFSSASYPVWSPDGESVLFVGRADSGVNAMTTLDWWVTPIDPNAPPDKRTTKTNACAAPNPETIVNDSDCPLPGDWQGRHVYFSVTTTGGSSIWRVELTAGNQVEAKPLKVTSGDGLEVQPFLAPGGHMVYGRQTLNADIWSIPASLNEGKTTGEPKRITKDPAFDIYPTLTADGSKLAFLSNRKGNYNPWLLDLKTGAETQVVNAQQDQMWPRISRDGAIVAYSEMRIGRFEQFFTPSGGGKSEVLCEDCGPIISDFAPDGKSVLIDFISQNRLTSISLVKIGSHDRVQILQHPSRNLMQARFSPDGRSLAFVARRDAGHSQIYVAPFHGDAPSPESGWTEITPGDTWDTAPNWSPDGSLIYYTSGRDGFRCVWARKLDGSRRPAGDPIGVYHFHTARRSPGLVPLNGVDLSTGAGQIFLSLGELSGSVWMAELPE